ncbi:hypothetical protein CP532_4353 [Ophiocordyceps camponoti-leonardi (nom. inval.)]|nr:hypothetical protein CP532_4353 [Ophiocordyceps camponoti-leonardi (nom. inval.)]
MEFSGHYHLGAGAQSAAYQSFLPMQHDFEAPDVVFDPFPHRAYDLTPTYHQPQQQQHHHHHQPQAFSDLPTPPPSTAGPTTVFGQQLQGAVTNVIHHLSGSVAKGFDDVIPTNQKGSDEEELLTPAQSRRKAQNRAAQRAFRERKEKHVKDLEAKLASLEAAQQKASVENERLRRDLQEMSTQNEMLRATTSSSTTVGVVIGRSSSSPTSPPEAAPCSSPLEEFYPSDEFYSTVLENSTFRKGSPSRRVVTSDDGEPLLAAGAAWDLIVSHQLYRRGLVDVGHVSDRLRGSARCDGKGPVFEERAVLEAIEQSVASGSDDLL